MVDLLVLLIFLVNIWLLPTALELSQLPPKRSFIPIHQDVALTGGNSVAAELRVLQFNILADGLSGLRVDLGGFSRANKYDMSWEYRKIRLMFEMLQYDPDVITLQECDHYYDFFLPELSKRGYDGMFAPKPASACLEVSENSDGCAIFFKRDKIRVISTETLTYALERETTLPAAAAAAAGRTSTSTSTTSSSSSSSSSIKASQQSLRVQNQVALVAICELQSTPRPLPTTTTTTTTTTNTINVTDDQGVTTGTGSSNKNDAHQQHMGATTSVPLIIATTHLKAAKSEEGELCRYQEAQQLLSAIERCRSNIVAAAAAAAAAAGAQGEGVGEDVAVLLTGDLNACPTPKSSQFGFACSVYPLIKQHPLRLRSVLNDDLKLVKGRLVPNMGMLDDANDTVSAAAAAAAAEVGEEEEEEEEEVWTTWKSRWKKGKELVVRHCIDYILYSSANMRAVRSVGVFRDEDVAPELFPSSAYPSDHIALVADLEIIHHHHHQHPATSLPPAQVSEATPSPSSASEVDGLPTPAATDSPSPTSSSSSSSIWARLYRKIQKFRS